MESEDGICDATGDKCTTHFSIKLTKSVAFRPRSYRNSSFPFLSNEQQTLQYTVHCVDIISVNH